MSEKSYEKKYNDLMANLDEMHKRNVRKTSAALKSLLIIPTIFLIFVFMTNSSKTVFLVLWIASMFTIAAILIVTEYQDYTIRKMLQSVADSDEQEELPEKSEVNEEPSSPTEEIAEEAVEEVAEDDEDDEAEAAVSEEYVVWSGEAASELSAWAEDFGDEDTAEASDEDAAFKYDTPDESAVREETEVGADS